VRLNAAIESAPGYPFLRLAEARRAAQASGIDVVDLSLGQPTDPAPAAVRAALADAAATLSLCEYPATGGLVELREAIAGWVARRFGVVIDPDTEILPTLGAKEPIALLARLFAAPGDTVALASPSYPVAERSARAERLLVYRQVLSAGDSWLLDPDAIPWRRTAIVWVVNPHNPTGAVAPRALLAELAERCRASGAILALDETYSEFYFAGDAPPSGLQLADRSGVVVFNSLSKRSGLAGLRSGFIAGDSQIVERITRHRSDIGTTPPAIIQRAAVAAWSDDEHVSEGRARYAAKRALLAKAAAGAGLEHVGGVGGIFLWLRVPGGEDERMMTALLERSLLMVPGSYLGPGGEGHLRAAVTPTAERIARAAELLAEGAFRCAEPPVVAG
jgi:N-succinyldiaminopimelate aminotransferase